MFGPRRGLEACQAASRLCLQQSRQRSFVPACEYRECLGQVKPLTHTVGLLSRLGSCQQRSELLTRRGRRAKDCRLRQLGGHQWHGWDSNPHSRSSKLRRDAKGLRTVPGKKNEPERACGGNRPRRAGLQVCNRRQPRSWGPNKKAAATGIEPVSGRLTAACPYQHGPHRNSAAR